jgi:transposase
LVPSAKLLDDASRTEKNVDVRERLLLVRRVLVDNEQISRVPENELHRSRWWAYKWVKRYAESGLEGLKNLPRTGRLPQVSGQKFVLLNILIPGQLLLAQTRVLDTIVGAGLSLLGVFTIWSFSYFKR